MKIFHFETPLGHQEQSLLGYCRKDMLYHKQNMWKHHRSYSSPSCLCLSLSAYTDQATGAPPPQLALKTMGTASPSPVGLSPRLLRPKPRFVIREQPKELHLALLKTPNQCEEIPCNLGLQLENHRERYSGKVEYRCKPYASGLYMLGSFYGPWLSLLSTQVWNEL